MNYVSLLTISALSLFSEGQGEASEQKGKEDDNSFCEAHHPMRVTARHIESNGIGYNEGYTTVEGFFSPYNGWENLVVFLDTRIHVFNNGRPALNAGLGSRYLTDKRAWGVNAYYDYRKNKRQHYNQVAMGFESLGKFWDFRLNGYVPVGKTRSRYYDTQFHEFDGNSAILRQRYEFAMAGFNAEAGVPLRFWDNYPLYFAAGPYYLTGKGGTTWGAEARVSMCVYEYVTLEAYTSYDHLFRWTGQGQVAINIPFGPKKKIQKKRNSGNSYCYAHTVAAYQPVSRFEIIPVDKKHKYSKAINPRTKTPYQFVFVDNTSSSAGTYQSPYPTLAEAEANSSSDSVIYVFPGDGSSTGMASGIVLKDYQKLWGSGVAQSLPTTVGTVVVPAQSNSTLNGMVFSPIITNTGTVVTLANGNEISGLFLQNGASSKAISGTNVTNATVLNCTIAGANVQGGIGFFATDLAGALTINNCILNQNNGIELSNSTTNLQTNISNSNFSGGDGSTTNSFLWTLSNSSQGTLTANNNKFDSGYTAIQVNAGDTSAISATINNNMIATGGYGIHIDGSGTASENLNMEGNNITAYYQSLWITETGALQANIANNTMNTTEEYCVEIDTSSGEGSIVMTGNSIISGDSYVIYFNQTGGSISSTLNENKIVSTDDEYGIYCNVGPLAINHTLNVNGNTIIGDYGWYLYQEGGVVSSIWNNNSVIANSTPIYTEELTSSISQTIVLNGNTITGEYGVYADQSVGTSSYTLNNNKITAIDDETGFYLDMYGTATSANVSLKGNQIFAETPVDVDSSVGDVTISVVDNALIGFYPAYFILSTPGTTTMQLSGNTMSGYYGIFVEESGAGTFNSTITNNTVTAAGYTAYTYTTSGVFAGNTTQVISGNTFTSGPFGNNAIDLVSDTSGTAQFTVTDNILVGGGGSSSSAAVSCAMTNGIQYLNLSNNTLPNSGGFSLTGVGGASITWNVNGNQFFASGSTPVSAAASGAGTNVCMQLNNNTAYPTVGAYVLTNTAPAVFKLNPPQGNIGELTTTNVTETVCP